MKKFVILMALFMALVLLAGCRDKPRGKRTVTTTEIVDVPVTKPELRSQTRTYDRHGREINVTPLHTATPNPPPASFAPAQKGP